jgi:glycosyltransferase involved in cell wall biosynthesis
MKISIVIPTLNEEKNIGKILKSIKNEMRKRKLKHEIIVVDGYSTDNTIKIAKKYNVKVLFDKLGKGSALRKGFKAAKGDIIISIDADLSHNPKEIGLLIEGIKTGYDICAGSRFIQGGGTADMPWYRKIGNKFFVLLVNFFWKTNYSDMCYGYRAFKKSVVKKLKLKTNGFGIETEIAIDAAKKRLKVLEIPSFEKKRAGGEGKLKTIKDGWEIFKIILSELLKK